MSYLESKNILILSPQSWGNMMLSKHHYAIELARKGNRVFFLSPPNDPKPSKPVLIKQSGLDENLFIVENSLFFPYNLKFHALPLFHFLIKWQIKRILKEIPVDIDIIWSFDIGNSFPLYKFPANTLKVFHPVDEPLSPESIKAGEGADIIFSVTREILEKYTHLDSPGYFINHGISEEFLHQEQDRHKAANEIKVGFSGNLLRNDLDKETLVKIVTENPEIQFGFWGTYKIMDSNIGGSADQSQVEFIKKLESLPNVKLYGAVSAHRLASSLSQMDAFLICYDVEKDQSKGTNYHKVMEYISTGKVIVSNNITTYKERPDLVQMIEERDSNSTLPALFRKVMGDIKGYNTEHLQKERVAFAHDNTYKNQVERIENYLKNLKRSNKT